MEQKQPSDKNPMPEIVPLPRLHAVSSFIAERLHFCYFASKNTGAAPMLDEQIYGQLEFDYDGNVETL